MIVLVLPGLVESSCKRRFDASFAFDTIIANQDYGSPIRSDCPFGREDFFLEEYALAVLGTIRFGQQWMVDTMVDAAGANRHLTRCQSSAVVRAELSRKRQKPGPSKTGGPNRLQTMEN
jgi:hypothetical protein